MPNETTMPAYAGDDLTGFMLKHGFELPVHGTWGAIRSMTNVRDTAIIVTEYAVFRARPYEQIGFTVKLVAHL